MESLSLLSAHFLLFLISLLGIYFLSCCFLFYQFWIHFRNNGPKLNWAFDFKPFITECEIKTIRFKVFEWAELFPHCGKRGEVIEIIPFIGRLQIRNWVVVLVCWGICPQDNHLGFLSQVGRSSLVACVGDLFWGVKTDCWKWPTEVAKFP